MDFSLWSWFGDFSGIWYGIIPRCRQVINVWKFSFHLIERKVSWHFMRSCCRYLYRRMSLKFGQNLCTILFSLKSFDKLVTKIFLITQHIIFAFPKTVTFVQMTVTWTESYFKIIVKVNSRVSYSRFIDSKC